MTHLQQRSAAYQRWAKEPDPRAATAAARAAYDARWEKLVDPEGALDPQERAVRAERLRKSHYADMARRSAQARRARRETTR